VDRDAVLRELKRTVGATYNFEVERTAKAIARDGLGRTFSAVAMDELRWQMSAWVSTRILRAMERGEIPLKVEVTITVGLDGKLAN
jgi:hypothetical protein